MKVHAFTVSARPTAESRRDSGYILPDTGDPHGLIPASWHSGLDKRCIHDFLSSGFDLLVICVPLNPQTTGLTGSKELAILSNSLEPSWMKPSDEYCARQGGEPGCARLDLDMAI
jgi:lactate dehydrogenase-like 2-hydroxyacid dehydrogenase